MLASKTFSKILGQIILAASLFAGCGFSKENHWLDHDRQNFPLVIAHRGGTGDYPENTLLAIQRSLDDGADGVWLSVQIDKNGEPVLYRSPDLSALTNATGPVKEKTAAELAQINAAWQFKQTDAAGNVSYPYREWDVGKQKIGIPTLRDALRAVPNHVPLFLDMKALPADIQAKAVAAVLEEENAWSRVSIYSTDASYQQAFAAYPQARVFESRDATRDRLFQAVLGGACDNPPPASSLTAFEYRRKVDVTVSEQFTLGKGITELRNVLARTWSKSAVACFRTNPHVKILAIAINNVEDYRAMACLGVDAVLVDSPRTMAVRPKCQLAVDG